MAYPCCLDGLNSHDTTADRRKCHHHFLSSTLFKFAYSSWHSSTSALEPSYGSTALNSIVEACDSKTPYFSPVGSVASDYLPARRNHEHFETFGSMFIGLCWMSRESFQLKLKHQDLLVAE